MVKLALPSLRSADGNRGRTGSHIVKMLRELMFVDEGARGRGVVGELVWNALASNINSLGRAAVAKCRGTPEAPDRPEGGHPRRPWLTSKFFTAFSATFIESTREWLMEVIVDGDAPARTENTIHELLSGFGPWL